MADKDLTVHLKADDKITPAAKKAKSSLDSIPDKVETKLDVDSSGIDNLSGKLGELPGMLGEVGGMLSGGGGIAAGVGAAAVAANNLAQGFAAAATEAKVTASLTGDTIEDASRLQSVWKTTGADVNDLNDVLLQMNGVLQTSPELAGQIGVNLKDGATVGQRFVEIVGKIQSSTLGASEKAQLMAQMFGEEGVRQVAKLTASIDGPLTSALEDVSDAQIISEEEAARAAELTEATKKLGQSWADLKMIAGEILLEPTARSIDKTNAIVEGFRKLLSLDFSSQGNDIGEWRNEFDQFSGADFGADIDDVTAATGRYTSAGKKAAAALVAQVDATFRAQNAARDYAATLAGVDFGAANLEGGIAGMTAFSDQFFGLARIASDTEAAYDNLAASIKENGKTFDLNTEAGRKNQEALEGVAATLDTQLAAAYDQADGDMDTFERNAEVISLTTLARLAKELGLNAQETQALGAQLGLLPEDIETRYALAGVEEAKMKLGLLSGSIEALPKDVQATVTQQIIAGDYQGALDTVNNYYAQNPARLPVQPYLTGINPKYNPGLGVIGGGPRMVEPEAGPTATATTATSTAVAPMAATPIVFNVPRQAVPTITVNTGVLGNRFDVDRTLTKALRRYQRLNGERS